VGFITLTPIPLEREPIAVDGDQLDQGRVSIFPQVPGGRLSPPDHREVKTLGV
jgi:hypothetical protein